MNKQEIAVKTSKKKAYRAEHVKRWKESGLTKAEYGRRNGIHPNVLMRWVKKYAEEKDSGHFVKINPQILPRDYKSEVEIILPGGIRIRMESNIHPIAMREIVNAIMGL
jgi:transposase-like protein